MVDVLSPASDMEQLFAQNASITEPWLEFKNYDPYTIKDIICALRSYFYLWGPSQTMVKSIDEVPNILIYVARYLPMMVFFECIGLYLQGQKLPRWNHCLMSFSTAILLFLPGPIIGNIEFTWFGMIYDKYRVVDLAYNSYVAWFACIFAADFSAYLWHRAAHEVNFIWAFHSVHHSSDEMNLTAAYRLPTFNRQVAILFFLPMAFVFPPGMFYVHYQLNYIYQLWVHTRLVDPPDWDWIEYIFITPRLHRVHHARNRYCIDKNYGAILSIWDVLFGTFAKCRPEDKVPLSYGLVSRYQSFDGVAVQFYYMKEIFKRAQTYDNWSDKISTFLKGPGWEPGKPRLGIYREIPQVYDDKPYDKTSPTWCYLYLTMSLAMSLYIYNLIPYVVQIDGKAPASVLGLFLFWGVTNSGYILEHKPWVPMSEVLRCMTYFYLESLFLPVIAPTSVFIPLLRAGFMLSILTWSFKLNMFVVKHDKLE